MPRAWTSKRQLPKKPLLEHELLPFVNRDLIPIIRSIKFRSDDGVPFVPQFTFVTATEDYSANPWEAVRCDASAGDTFTISLPDPALVVGAQILVTMLSSRYIYGRVNVVPTAGYIGEATTSLTLGDYVDAVLFLSDGERWLVMANYRPQKWIGSKLFDFTTHAALTIVNGNNTIYDVLGNASTFVGENIGNATSVAIVPGIGLRFQASVVDTEIFNTTRTSPILRADILTQLMQFYGCTNHIPRIQAHMVETNMDADNEAMILGVESSTLSAGAGTHQRYRVQKEYVSGAGGKRIVSYFDTVGVSSIRGSNVTVNDDVYGITFEAPNYFSGFSSVYDGTGFLNCDHPWDSGIQIMTTPLFTENTRPRVIIAQQTNNTNGDFVMVVPRLQIDYVEKRPFINP